MGSWDHLNLLNKLNLNFNIKINKFFSVYGGPAFNVYYSNQPEAVSGYKFTIPSLGTHLFDFGNSKVKSWIGWNAGINLF